jgi:hypothetical protein
VKNIKFPLYLAIVLTISMGFHWGFYAHKQINRLAVFTLPPSMIGFYKKNIEYIAEASVNPDRRRFSVVDEAPRHYLDLDHYGDSALFKMPKFWNDAVAKYTEDTLKSYGILPWHINKMYYQLKDAFAVKDPQRILKLSAEIGHYLADAHVPLHTTENYNGQLTGQEGIHAFWESRLPELFANNYDYVVGKATYLDNVQLAVWKVIESSHSAVDSVLVKERKLSLNFGERKYSFETKGKQTLKVYSKEYAKAYHEMLEGMVEKQMRGAILLIGSFWFTAWVDAGQPDIKKLIDYAPSEEELQRNREELAVWKQQQIRTREHENPFVGN